VSVRGGAGPVPDTVTARFGQRVLVKRPLPPEVAESSALAGAAVMPDGQIALIVDCDALKTSTHLLAA
jgi:two-component system chemotaxis sensor kinase CheA